MFLVDAEGQDCVDHALTQSAIYCLQKDMRPGNAAGDVAIHMRLSSDLGKLPITPKSKHVLHDIEKFRE